jgi:hypothetical protein
MYYSVENKASVDMYSDEGRLLLSIQKRPKRFVLKI